MIRKVTDQCPTDNSPSNALPSPHTTLDEIKAALLISREQQLRSSGHLWEMLSGIADQIRELVSAVWTLIDEIRALRRQLAGRSSS
jgi:hypothetical protein